MCTCVGGWRDAYFNFRDKIEILFPSVSFLKTRTRIFSPYLRVRDQIESFVRFIPASRKDREFLSFNLEIRDEIKIFQWKRPLVLPQTRLWCLVDSMKSYRGMRTIQLQYIFNINISITFTFVQLVSRQDETKWEQSLQKSGESESSVMVLGKMMLLIIFTHVWINYIYAIWRWKKQ